MADTIQFKSDFPVELIQFTGGDDYVSAAARVSTRGWNSLSEEESQGLIRFLMSNRHGSPFEHGLFTWRISATIFIWRELMRHRIASYNEESGRYKQLEGVFYLPPETRPLIQVGKAGKYTYEQGTIEQRDKHIKRMKRGARKAYKDYLVALEDGIAKEVARMVLPINIYSTAWVSMNPRGLMNFLSLRTKHESAMFPSFPMWEINQVANSMEEAFAHKMPLTWKAFREGGSVCP